MRTIGAFVFALVLATGAAMAQGTGGSGSGGQGGGTEPGNERCQYRQGRVCHPDCCAVREGLGFVPEHLAVRVQHEMSEEVAFAPG